MDKTLQELCLEIAGHAEANRYSVLAYLLQVAAAEAKRSVPLSHVVNFSLNSPPEPKTVGVWDLDVSNNMAYLDPVGSNFFGQNAAKAAQGVPLSAYLEKMHPDDIGGFAQKLNLALGTGGVFVHDYRVIANDRIRWVHADGNCTLDHHGRPVRAIGSIIDITEMKEIDAQRISIAPL